MPTAEEIRTRMAQIRCDILDDVEGVVANARTMADWRYYVTTYPWSSVAAAIAAGYFLVPPRVEVIQPDTKAFTKWAKENRLVVEGEPDSAKHKGMTAALLAMAGNALLKGALAYGSQYVGRLMTRQMLEPRPEEPTVEGARFR